MYGVILMIIGDALLIHAGEPNLEAPQCLKIDVESEEFRCSPGGYDPDSLTVEKCLDGCAEIEYKYAGIVRGIECLCSQTIPASTEEDCSVTCSGDSTQICGSEDLNILSVYTVPDKGNLDGVALKIASNEIYTSDVLSVEATVTKSVPVTLKVDFGDGTATKYSEGENFVVQKHYQIPGQYTIFATATDDDVGKTVYSEEFNVKVEEAALKVQLQCPKFIRPGEGVNCTASLWRGSEAKLEVEIEDGDGIEEFEIPDASILPAGLPVPEKEAIALTDEPNESSVRLPYVRLPRGRVLLFEYYAVTPGDFEFLVLRPDCSDESYCLATVSCGGTCSSPDSYTCDSIWSGTGKCFSDGDSCSLIVEGTNYKEVYRYQVTATEDGYNDFLPEEDAKDILPGDIIGFESKSGAIGRRAATETEKAMSLEDTNSEGIKLGVRHYFRALVVQPSDIHVNNIIEKNGKRYVKVTFKNGREDSQATEVRYIDVVEPIENMTLSIDNDIVTVGENYLLTLSFAKGSDINVTWEYGNGTEEDEFVNDPSVDSERVIKCLDEGKYIITVNASNVYGSFSQSVQLECFYGITDFWILENNSPQHFPPGNVEIVLTFSDDGPMPTRPSGEIAFGDGHSEAIVLPERWVGQWNTVINHRYSELSDYDVSVNISNIVGYKVITTKIELYPGNQDFNITVTHVTDSLNTEKDPEVINVYVDEDITFNITFGDGGADCYQIKLDDGITLYNSTDPIFHHQFKKPGIYRAVFTAFFYDLSKDYSLVINAFRRLMGLFISHDGTIPGYGVEKAFNVTLLVFDEYTCLVFSPGDDSIREGFGNELVCREKYQDDIVYVGPIEDMPIVVNHAYEDQYMAVTKVEAFNALSTLKNETLIIVKALEEGAPIVWIDKNHTHISDPDERMKSIEFRLETTTILTSDISYTVLRNWRIYKVDSAANEIGEVDISSLASYNASAIVIPPLFLDIGLYKFHHNVCLVDEDDRGKCLFISSDFSYIKIKPSPLSPKIIDDQVFMVRRGYGQILHLKAGSLSCDPDDPSDKNFLVTWFCRRAEETLEEDEKGNLKKVNPSSPIKDKSKAGSNEGGCFGKGPGVVEMEEPNVEFNTEWFLEADATYVFEIEMQKDTRKGRTALAVEVVGGEPPILTIRCEKSKVCFPIEGKLNYNPGTWITMKAECIDSCAEKMRYKWKVWGLKSKSYDDNDKTDLTDSGSPLIRSDKLRIAVNQSIHNEFKEYVQFRFEITGQKEGKQEGMAVVYLIRNDPPQGGTCVIKTVEGKALLEYSHFSCTGWIDPETNSEETVDEYSLLSFYNGQNTLRLRYGTKTEFPVVLPCGEMKLQASIRDIYGAITAINVLNIATIPPEYEEFLAWNDSRAFEKALAEGYMGLAAQIVMAEVSCTTNFSDGSGGDELEMALQDPNYINQDAVEEKWREYLELSGKDSSFYSPQAREEIEEMIRDEMEERLDNGMQQKKKRIQKLERVPVQTMQDAEVKICALSAIVSKGLMDGEGQDMSLRVIEDVSAIINETEITHPDELKHSLVAICTIMDSVATSLAAQMMNGFAFKSSREEAVQNVDWNPETTNPFVLYVNNKSKKENKQMMRDRAFQAAANESRERGRETIEKMKEVLDFLTNIVETDMMTNDPTFITETKTGFVLKILKLPVENLTDMEIDLGRAKCKLPSDPCILMGESPGSCTLEEETSVSVLATKWSSILESYSEDVTLLGKDSATVQVSTADPDSGKSYKHDPVEMDNYITNLENGNSGTGRRLLESGSPNSSLEYEYNLKQQNSDEMFEICIPRRENPRENVSFNRITPVFLRDSDVIVYHPFQMKSPGVVLVVQIIPDVPEAPFVFLHKCGTKPTLSDYDGIWSLNDLKEENGTFTLNLPGDTCIDGNSTFYFAVGHLANYTNAEKFFSQPDIYNLTVANMTNKFSSNYSYRLYTTGCYYFEEATEMWDMEGCQVSSASLFTTCCLCNHLTSFGGGLFVAPNTVDFSYVFAHTDFTKNIVIYVTLIITFSVYIVILIWARWKDRKDVEKLGATPLPDNDPNDKYIYEILVFTGHQANAGTKSKVFFLVSGEDEETEVRTLADGKRPILKSGSVDVFIMTTARPLGDLYYLRVWHDNSGSGKWASWYLKYIVFRDIQTGQKFEFIANRWFAVEEGDGLIDHLLPVAGKEQKTEFTHLFSTTTRQKLSDSHLWFSVFLRPPRSRFTRVQRVSCCMAVLYLSMLANAMWYQRSSNQTASGGIKLGPFSLTLEQLAVGIASNFVVFPPTFLMIFFFRKSRPRKLRRSRIQEALKKQREEWQAEFGTITENEEIGKTSGEQSKPPETGFKRKRKFTLPWWCVIFGWMLVIGSIGVSLFFLWAYGIQFGNEKTSKWLTALVISFFSSVLLTQPIKIFLMAIFLSMICQKLDYDEDDADEDEEDPHLGADEEWLHSPPPVRPERHAYRPLDPKAIEAARERRKKELMMNNLLREGAAYGIFLWIVIVICMAERDPNCYYMRLNLINDFIKPGDLWVDFNNVNTDRKFWNWTTEALIPELIAGDWYNGRPPLGLRGFLDDRNNLKISYAVMRQVRIKPDSCEVAWQIRNQTPECAGYGTIVFEDGAMYARRWKTNYTEDTAIPPEYKYLTASQLKGYPFWGKMDYYGGGGYVVPLFEKQDDVREAVKRLQREGWINRHTRAVFIEIAVYNAQVNLFGAVTIVAEVLPGGGITPYYHIDPIRLLFYHNNNGTFFLIIQILFLAFLLYFTIRELRSMFKQRLKYLDQYWNICELFNLIFSYTGIVFYVLRLLLTQKILKVFRETDGTGYVKLQEAVLLDSMVCYMLACVMFLATLRFLKLLRFNKRMGILAQTLRKCAIELRSFGICLMVVFVSFVFLFWLLLGRFMWEFSTFVLSFESCISMLLKKFKYPQMAAASPIFVPIVFCIFSIMAATVLINILLTIIIQSFEEVKQDVIKKGKDEELLQFMVERLKSVVGVGNSRVHPLPPIVPKTTTVPDEDTVDSFPSKVDQLLQFVNTVYCDSQIDFNSKEFLKKMKAGQNSDEGRSSRGAKRRPSALGKYGSESMRRRLGDI